MKKFTTIMGAIGALIFTLGFLFKFLHWPGSGLFIIFGAMILLIFFLPVYGYNLFYEISGNKSKTVGVFGAITFCLILIATVAKFMHWPGAVLFLLFEFAFAALFLVPSLMIIKIKLAGNGKQKSAILSGYIALSLLLLGLISKILRWPGGAPILILGGLIMLFVYLPIIITIYNTDFERKKLKTKIILLPLIAVLAFFIFGGSASAGILNSFINIDNSIKDSEAGPNVKKEMFYSSCKKNKTGAPEDTNIALLYAKEMKVKELSDNLYNHIEKLKAYLISKTDRKPLQVPTPKLEEVDSKDNYDIPTFVLIGDDELNPNKGAYTAGELKAKIDVYRMDILSMYKAGRWRENADKTIGLKTNLTVKIDGLNLPWESYNFYHLPLVTIITYLSKLQLDIRTTEVATLEYLYSYVPDKDLYKTI